MFISKQEHQTIGCCNTLRPLLTRNEGQQIIGNHVRGEAYADPVQQIIGYVRGTYADPVSSQPPNVEEAGKPPSLWNLACKEANSTAMASIPASTTFSSPSPQPSSLTFSRFHLLPTPSIFHSPRRPSATALVPGAAPNRVRLSVRCFAGSFFFFFFWISTPSSPLPPFPPRPTNTCLVQPPDFFDCSISYHQLHLFVYDLVQLWRRS